MVPYLQEFLASSPFNPLCPLASLELLSAFSIALAAGQTAGACIPLTCQHSKASAEQPFPGL